MSPQKLGASSLYGGRQLHPSVAAAWDAVCDAWNRQCAYCGRRAALTIEHVEPQTRGGEDVPENIVPACGFCNASKGNLLLLEWVAVEYGLVKRTGVGNSYKHLALCDPPRPAYGRLATILNAQRVTA